MAFKRTKILDFFFSSFAAPPPQLYIEILVRKFQRYIYLPKYILDDQLKKFFNSFSPIIHFNLPITKRFFDLSVECTNPNSYQISPNEPIRVASTKIGI